MRISAKFGQLAVSALAFGGIAALSGSWPAPLIAQERIGSGIENAPDFVLPEAFAAPADPGTDGLAAQSATATPAAADDPAAQLLGVIREEISEKYAEGDVDPDRLSRLVDGSYMTDYVKGSPTEGPVQFSNSFFDTSVLAAPVAVEPADEVPTPRQDEARTGQILPADKAFQQFMMTPEGMRAIAGMSEDQIRGIAYLMQAMSGEASPPAPAQAALTGIPGLEDQDIAGVDPQELLRKAAAGGGEEPRIVEVGDGKTLGLADWVARQSPEGRMQIENTLIAGSAIDVAEGMVVGQFGRVAKIVSNEAESYVEFETGDRILGKSPVLLSNAVPGLDDELAPETASEAAAGSAGRAPGTAVPGEIIISIAPPSAPPARPAEWRASVPASPGAGAGDAAFRPRPRPAVFERPREPAVASGMAPLAPASAVVETASAAVTRMHPRPRPAHLAEKHATRPAGLVRAPLDPDDAAVPVAVKHAKDGEFRPKPRPVSGQSMAAHPDAHPDAHPAAHPAAQAQMIRPTADPGLFRPKPRPRRG